MESKRAGGRGWSRVKWTWMKKKNDEKWFKVDELRKILPAFLTQTWSLEQDQYNKIGKYV